MEEYGGPAFSIVNCQAELRWELRAPRREGIDTESLAVSE